MTEVATVIERMNSLREDSTVPNNVKELLQEAVNQLRNEEDELALRVNAATSFLDEASNDPNIQQFTRTELWNIASLLEKMGGNGE